MKYIDEYRNKKIAAELVQDINKALKGCRDEISLMEVCGTHTMAIFRYGIRDILPRNIKLLSGPGCPVCVTPVGDIDRIIKLAGLKDLILTTFGDMLKVPGTKLSLRDKKAEGADVRIVYSCLDALDIARNNPEKRVVFFAVGFETTSPTIAATIQEAKKKKIKNFFCLCAHKTIPEAMRVLVETPRLNINGFICPGHVSTIIGSAPYQFLARDYKIPCVIAGFEPVDILQTIYMLIKQHIKKTASVEIQYKRCVEFKGNRQAQAVLNNVFEKDDAIWRGIGQIPDSGLKIRNRFKEFDAEFVFKLAKTKNKNTENKNCLCGSVLRGLITPRECKLFSRVCNPEHPVGPCMVSSEGTCAAYYRYGNI